MGMQSFDNSNDFYKKYNEFTDTWLKAITNHQDTFLFNGYTFETKSCMHLSLYEIREYIKKPKLNDNSKPELFPILYEKHQRIWSFIAFSIFALALIFGFPICLLLDMCGDIFAAIKICIHDIFYSSKKNMIRDLKITKNAFNNLVKLSTKKDVLIIKGTIPNE